MLFRGKQAVREFPVIGDKEQPFGIDIEPADREQIFFARFINEYSSTVSCLKSSVADTQPAGLFNI